MSGNVSNLTLLPLNNTILPSSPPNGVGPAAIVATLSNSLTETIDLSGFRNTYPDFKPVTMKVINTSSVPFQYIINPNSISEVGVVRPGTVSTRPIPNETQNATKVYYSTGLSEFMWEPIKVVFYNFPLTPSETSLWVANPPYFFSGFVGASTPIFTTPLNIKVNKIKLGVANISGSFLSTLNLQYSSTNILTWTYYSSLTSVNVEFDFRSCPLYIPGSQNITLVSGGGASSTTYYSIGFFFDLPSVLARG